MRNGKWKIAFGLPASPLPLFPSFPSSPIIPLMTREWRISRNQTLPIGERTLVMGVLNVTPDSFSDGGQFFSLDKALAHAEQMIAEGADIIDVGGESTRPGSAAIVSAEEELERVLPAIKQLTAQFDVPISIDTTKASVARAALDAGAAIVNDISALRFDPKIADEVAKSGAGLVLMHSRGTPGALHNLPPVADIMEEVTSSLRSSIEIAEQRGVKRESHCYRSGDRFRQESGTKPRTDRQTRSTHRRLPRLPSSDRHLAKIFHRPHPR